MRAVDIANVALSAMKKPNKDTTLFPTLKRITNFIRYTFKALSTYARSIVDATLTNLSPDNQTKHSLEFTKNTYKPSVKGKKEMSRLDVKVIMETTDPTTQKKTSNTLVDLPNMSLLDTVKLQRKMLGALDARLAEQEVELSGVAPTPVS